jgi:signal transduction histidine kinase
VRRAKFFRTSSFRLTLLYTAITCPAFLVLFGVIYWSCTAYVEDEVDTSVASAVASISSETADMNSADAIKTIGSLIGRSPGLFLLLEDPAGTPLAGNLPAMAPVLGIQERRRLHAGPQDRAKIVRGLGTWLANGNYLFVALNVYELHEMQEVIERGFFWGLAATLLMAMAGGGAVSVSVLGRVEALSRAGRDIMAGNLTRRLPLTGTKDEFDHLAASLNAMLDRIQVLMDTTCQVSTNIAHDLRTPLSRLRQRIEFALRKPPDVETLRIALEGTVAEVDAVLETFAALLRIAEIESSTRRARFSQVDLTAILETVVEVYLPFAEERRQALTASIAPGLSVDGDRDLLLQLFANLLENAIRHAPERARIGIAAGGNENDLEVVITDNGPGIPLTARGRVFERFFRLDAGRTTPGNGLGLSLAAAVAALHGTEIVLADNEPGLKVTVRLDMRGTAEGTTTPTARQEMPATGGI